MVMRPPPTHTQFGTIQYVQYQLSDAIVDAAVIRPSLLYSSCDYHDSNPWFHQICWLKLHNNSQAFNQRLSHPTYWWIKWPKLHCCIKRTTWSQGRRPSAAKMYRIFISFNSHLGFLLQVQYFNLELPKPWKADLDCCHGDVLKTF
jgi:hypothetical protein